MLLNIKKFLRKGEELGKLYPMFPSVPLPCIFSIARKSHTANKHPFPAKCKSILPYTFFRQPFRGERSLIIPFLYLPQGILYRIGQFFFFLILNSIMMALSCRSLGSSITSYLPNPLSRLDVSTYLSASSTIIPSTKPW